MKGLSQIFEAAGCKPVKTYIQSGNVVFNALIKTVDRFADTIGTTIEKEYGFRTATKLAGLASTIE